MQPSDGMILEIGPRLEGHSITFLDILMKMASWRSRGGPMGKDLSKQTKKMFYMVSTDIDAFRRFVFETKFLPTYDIDADMVDAVRAGDEALLQLGGA